MNIGTSYVARGAENVGVKLVNNLIRWMVLMMALLLAGCPPCPPCTTLPGQTAEQPESLTSLPVVRGCEVGQQLPIGEPCEWSTPDADGMISAESRDGRHLSLKLDGPCGFQREVRNPYDWIEAPVVRGGCLGIFDLKGGRADFGDGKGSGLRVKLAFGDHGWTVIQTPPMTP